MGRPSGHGRPSTEPVGYESYESSRTQPPPHRGSQGFYDDRQPYRNPPDQRLSHQHPYGQQHHQPPTQGWYLPQTEGKPHGHSGAHHRPSSFDKPFEPNYQYEQKTNPGPPSSHLERDEEYWFKQRQQKQKSSWKLRSKPQSVPTSPTSENHPQNIAKRHLSPGDENVRSSSAEGYHQERKWQGQPQGQRRGSWDRCPPEQMSQHQVHHQPSSPKAHGWPESRETSTQPHGWGSSSGSQRRRSPSPRRHQQESPKRQYSPSRPEIISDWSYDTPYDPRANANTKLPYPGHQTGVRDNQYNDDDYAPPYYQGKGPYNMGWSKKDQRSGPQASEPRPHAEQYDFQSYKDPQHYATTLDHPYMDQPNAPPKKPERQHKKAHRPDQYNREYNIYADPDQVRQMKSAQKLSGPVHDVPSQQQHPNEWTLPKSADELRKQFTASSKDRADIRKDKYTKFYVTASPEPSALNRIDPEQSPRESQHSGSRHESSYEDSSTSGPKIEKLIAGIRQKYEHEKEPSPKPKKKSKSVLHFDIKTEKPGQRPAYVVKANEEPEKPTPVNLGAIKANLFGAGGESADDPKVHDDKMQLKSNIKVSEIRTEIFNTQDRVIPQVIPTMSRPSSKHFDEENDQRILAYASYRDGNRPRRSHIEDELTDLERTYEELNLNTEEEWDRALEREAARGQSGEDLGKVRRLSITNLRKLETLQQKEGKPSLDYTRNWLANDAAQAGPQDDNVSSKKSTSDYSDVLSPSGKGSPESAEVSRYTSPTQAHPFVPQGEDIVVDNRSVGSSGWNPSSSFPLKVGDDMAFRRQRGSSATTKPGASTGSYLATASPAMTPATSMDSINRRPHSHRSRRSSTPDVVYDDMAMRNRQRLASAGEAGPASPVSPSPTSADYLKPRETAPARGRMRSRPEPHADKFHDDFAYRQLRKDVAPVKVELPKGYAEMRKDLQLRPRRTQSLDRVDQEDDQSRGRRIHHQRSASIGDTQQMPNLERRASMSKGIAKIVNLFDAPDKVSTSAPDLTDESAFKDAYNERGEIVGSNEPKETSRPKKNRRPVAKQQPKQQTPRIVKQRNEYKSRMKSQTFRSESHSYTESESDTYSSTYSSGASGGDRLNRSPPDGATHSDETNQLQQPDSPIESSTTSPDYERTQVKTSWQPSAVNARVISQQQRSTVQQIVGQHRMSSDMQVKQPTLSTIKTIPIQRIQTHPSNEPQEPLPQRAFTVKLPVENLQASSAGPISDEPNRSNEEMRVFAISRAPTAIKPQSPDSPQSPKVAQQSHVSNTEQRFSQPSQSSVSKEVVHIHKLGTTSTTPDKKTAPVHIVQAESKMVETKVPLAPLRAPSAHLQPQSLVKRQAEMLEKQGQEKEEKPLLKPEEIKESMSVLEQWKIQAEQKKRELQERLEKELQEEKDRSRKQRQVYEREVMRQSQTTRIERRVSEKTQQVLEEKKEVKTVTKGKKLETQQLILKGQEKMLAHRGLVTKPGQKKKLQTLDDLVASQPIASDLELDFSDYDNLETSDPDAGNGSDSDDSQKGIREQNLKRQKKARQKKVSNPQPITEPSEPVKVENEKPLEQKSYQRTEVTLTERTETTTPDGGTTVSQNTTTEVTSSGDKCEDDIDNEEKPRLGRRPSFKDIVQSFEDKAPTFMRKPVLRRCNSQDSVQQDDLEDSFEPIRLKDISGSEPNLRDRDGPKQKYHKIGGYYSELGSKRDPVSEF